MTALISQGDLHWFDIRLAKAVYDTNREYMNRRLWELARNQELASRGETPIGNTTVPIPSPFLKVENTSMSVTGLQSGAFQAKLAEMRKRIADSQNAGLAKIDSIVSDGEKKLQAAAEGVAEKAQSEVDNALQEFSQFTNGGPA